MCNLDHTHDHADDRYGFLVDTPQIRALVAAARQQIERDVEHLKRIEALEPVFANLLASDGWLPPEFAAPDTKSKMGDGIGQYALYRAEDGSLSLFSLVIPAGAETPVHDHLAWGLIGVYRGQQQETVYRRLDDASDSSRATLEIAKQQVQNPGDFYALIPPTDDIHYVKTTSPDASVSIHLLANDTACVWRHKFEPDTGVVTAFRSGYANAPCDEDQVAVEH
jgi:predicted metal-dependent enzyme (double-stranded beta helix superfamily)